MNSYNVARFTAWNAILGGLAACATLALSVVVTGGDIEMVPHGSAMLALPAEGRDLFRWWMLADVLGFYLPFVAIGGYFVHTFREELGALREMIVIAVAVYIVCGIAGAVLQLSTIHPLAHVYASGDEGAKVAAATVWTSIANATQNGFWWAEGPLVFFWTSIAARLLKKSGWRGSFLLHIVGWGFGVFFVCGFFPSLAAVTDAGETVAVLALPLWMLIFGWQLLRHAPALAVPTARPA